MVTTLNDSHRSVFDAFAKAAKKRNLKTTTSASNRSLVLELADASFIEPFVGTHRIQRIPPGSKSRHTSTMTLCIVSEVEAKVELNESDLHERFKRGKGPGGQHKNKTDSCVVLTHVPSGIVVTIDGRNQWQNRQAARKELASRLAERALEASQTAQNGQRAEQSASERSAKSFTHNEQRDEILDHESNRRWRMSSFMKGKI